MSHEPKPTPYTDKFAESCVTFAHIIHKKRENQDYKASFAESEFVMALDNMRKLENALADANAYIAALPVTDGVWKALEKIANHNIFAVPQYEIREIARAALATRAAPPLPESPWKGMESAPRGKEWFLLCDDDGDFYTASHDGSPVPGYRVRGLGWISEDAFREGGFIGWMPLPATPDSPKGGEDAR